MRRKFLLFLALFLIITDTMGILFSHHGLVDLVRFNRVIDAKVANLVELEIENRELKRRVDLLDQSSGFTWDLQVRELLGWVRSDEIVYFEKRSGL